MSNQKRSLMEAWLKDAWVSVFIHPRHPEVQVPDYLKQESYLVLQYGYNMTIPIEDLHIDDRGISATLLFGRSLVSTFIPWGAVFSITDGDQRIRLWTEDLPPDLEQLLILNQPKKAGSGSDETDEQSEKAPSKKRPPYLKLLN